MKHNAPAPRKEMPDSHLSATGFKARFRAQFADPAFDELSDELERVTADAWDADAGGRKSPRTRKAGPEFADADYELASDWLAARAAIAAGTLNCRGRNLRWSTP